MIPVFCHFGFASLFIPAPPGSRVSVKTRFVLEPYVKPGLCIKLPILLKIVFFSLHPGGQPRDEVLLLQNPVYGKTELRSGKTLIGMFLQDSHETLSLSKMPGLLFLADLSVLQVPGLHLHSEPMSCRDGF